MEKLINKIYKCDNMELLKKIPDNIIDLIYCDILYGTGKDFVDYQDLKCDREIIKEHYVPRIKEMYRVLKDTGSIYLQIDTRINHWIRCIMDDVFGYDNFVNEIIWCYKTTLKVLKNMFGKNHDCILFYKKTDNFKFNPYREDFMPSKSTLQRYGKYADEHRFVNSKYIKSGKNSILKNTGFYINNGIPIDWWEISHITGGKRKEIEHGKYFSQKPKSLLERIIKSSSNESDIVADFYMGSGTSMVVAKELNRNYIGCDISEKAVEIAKRRIK